MTKTTLAGIVLDESIDVSVDELCVTCSATSSWVVELVEEGIIEPIDPAATEWRFQGPSVTRAQVAMRLKRDLDINTPGIALALDLLEEIHGLRQRLERIAAGDRKGVTR